jgi:hypothetical protein
MNVAIPDAVSIFWIRAIAFRGACGASSSSSSFTSFSSSPWSVAQFGDDFLTEFGHRSNAFLQLDCDLRRLGSVREADAFHSQHRSDDVLRAWFHLRLWFSANLEGAILCFFVLFHLPLRV